MGEMHSGGGAAEGSGQQNQAQSMRKTRIRQFRRIMTWALAAGIAAFLIVPFLIPFTSSGTLTHREAAQPSATFVDVNGTEILVESTPYVGDESAEAPLFVLLHGFGASTFSWREVVEPLSKLGQVVAYDRPAFGFTERPLHWVGENPYGYRANAEILSALIAKYGEGREIILVGHSSGGQLAAAYAEQFPDRVQRLVLVDPAIFTTGGMPEGLAWVLDVPQIDRLGPFFVQGIASSGLEVLARSVYNPTLITDDIVAGYTAPLQVIGWEEALWEFTKAPRPIEVAERLRDIQQPTLVISGEDDTIVPVSDSERVASAIDNSSFMIITQSGHLPHEEQPKVFVHTVSEWLKTTHVAAAD